MDSFGLLVAGLHKTVIVSAATSMAMFGITIQDFLTNDVKSVITAVVTGTDDPPEKQIDEALG
ncbi:hypothetical protein [Stenotrophomonas sp. 278]|uniref:hypothetical protein n=1 Tax=Stenotrophomonas sp. 278 TaxID=2479851 RepID=UPI000F67AE31|nr:hypothetical protein [Stenotrophomonas sp. 278]